MNLLGTVSDIFWHKSIWLPPNFTWAQLEPKYEYQFTDYRHIYLYPIPLAFVVLFIRYLTEKYWFSPLGLKLGIKASKVKKLDENVILEKEFLKESNLKHKEIVGLAKRLDWTERQVLRWFRIRKMQGKPTTLVKFCENSWRCLYYTSSFVYGLIILWNKEWLWDIDHCWLNYPFQGVTRDVWWYYMISLAFYWSLTFSQFFDVKRKDFWQMFIHHIATIVLLSFSYICNFHRIGTLVLVVHDAADCILDGTKAAKYAKYDQLCTVLFGVFMLVWIVTRIIVFPVWLLWGTTVRAPYVAKMMFPAYYIFNGLLILLLILHIFWTKLILQLAYRTWTAGQLEGDIRSSASSDESDESVQSPLHNNHKVIENHENKATQNNHADSKN